jgi:hypothetical protein
LGQIPNIVDLDSRHTPNLIFYLLTSLAAAAQPSSPSSTITARWFRDNVGFIIEQKGSLWCTKQLKHVKWSSADNLWDIVQRLVANVAKFVYFSTLNITEIEQFLPAAAIDHFSADASIPVNLRQLATKTMHRQQNQVGNGSKLALSNCY